MFNLNSLVACRMCFSVVIAIPIFFLFTQVQTTQKQQQGAKTEKTQSTIPVAFVSESKYRADSPEQMSKEKMIAQWIGRSGLPARTVEDDDFILMIESIDKKLAVPKKTKINNLVDHLYYDEKQKFREQLIIARKINLGLDIWTKRGLTASFLAISACYFCPQEEKAKHILLNLVQLSHPHTADCIKACVDRCTQEWGIPQNKILTVITDHGTNMVAAFKNKEQDDHSSTEDESQEDNEDDSESEDVEDQR